MFKRLHNSQSLAVSLKTDTQNERKYSKKLLDTIRRAYGTKSRPYID